MEERTCLACGCTDSRACPEGCSWVDPKINVCSACVAKASNDFDAIVADQAREIQMRNNLYLGLIRKGKMKERLAGQRLAISFVILMRLKAQQRDFEDRKPTILAAG